MRRGGFSLIELLIAAAILGILLAVLGAFFATQQRVTTQQVTQASINNDTRKALLRIGDIVTQAAYIYPAGEVITAGDRSFTTGDKVLAVLLPRYEDADPERSSPYCNGNPGATPPNRYCGYLFSVENASTFDSTLGGDSSATGFALVEHRVPEFNWPKKTLPSADWGETLNSSPLANSVVPPGDPAADPAEGDFTSLGRAENLTLSGFGSSFDESDETEFALAVIGPDSASSVTTQAQLGAGGGNPLINAVNINLVLEALNQGKTLTSERSSTFFTRSVPREALPN